MGKYSKAVGAFIGAIFSIGAVFGLGDGNMIFGIDQATALAFLTPLVTVIATYIAPANS